MTRFYDGGHRVVHDWTEDCRIDCAHTSAMDDWRERLEPGFRAAVEAARADDAESERLTRIVDDVQAGRVRADMHQMPEPEPRAHPGWLLAVPLAGLAIVAAALVLT